MGAGGTARVYRGRYHKREVAIKMLYCMTLTAETIDNFCREAMLLDGIRDPNVVRVEGVCVRPPSVCIVMELCVGNLFEYVRLAETGLQDWEHRLMLAIDCARGVACLHERVPPILHKVCRGVGGLA